MKFLARLKPLNSCCILPLHFIICFIGLVGLLNNLSKVVVKGFYHNSVMLNAYFLNFYYPNKKEEIVYYLLVVLVLFIYSCASYGALIIKNLAKQNQFSKILGKVEWQIVYFIGILILNLSQFKVTTTYYLGVLGLTLIWLSIFCFPFCWRYNNSKMTFCFPFYRRYNNIKITKIYLGLLILVILQFGAVFFPFIFSDIQMINEYFDIPEETILDDVIINNIDYINRNQLLNPRTKKYNLEENNKPNNLVDDKFSVYLTKNAEVMEFLNDKKNQGRFYYNDQLNKLYSVDDINKQDWLRLNYIVTEKDRRAIDILYTNNEKLIYNFENRIFTKEEQEFLKKNRFEVHWQILNRWVIHHHNFILGPINEYALGKDINDIFMQYGWLNIVMMKNLLDQVGGISYQNYFKVWYSFYYIYYIMYLCLLFLIFRRVDYVLITSLISFALLNSINYQFIFLGPGLNPIRHFFDLFVIAFLFLHIQYQKKYYLLLSLFFALLGILNNSQMGFFCFISLISILLIKFYLEQNNRDWMEIALILLAGAAGIYLLVEYRIGTDLMSKYYVDGLLGFPLKSKYLYIAFVFFAIGYITIMRALNVSGVVKYLALFMLLYTQTMFIYYVWGATEPHFRNFASIYALTSVLILNLLIENVKFFQQNRFRIINLIVLLCLCFYLPTVSQYYKAKKEYQDVFNTHVTYKWNMDKAKFTSTMNPKYFEESVSLIHRYSDQNSIYILSKYDAFLPFLSNRYSAMPFSDVSMFLITSLEVQKCIDKIKTDNPQYLFLDTDINRPWETDIISKLSYFGYLHDESVWRVQRLNLLKEIYKEIKDEYEPLEKGSLITVYKKRL